MGMQVKMMRMLSCLLVAWLGLATGCGSGSGSPPGQTGGTPGIGTGGTSSDTGRGGATVAGGNGGAGTSGGQGSGGDAAMPVTGGTPAGGTSGSSSAQTGGSSSPASGGATGGVSATGGQGSGGKNTGGSSGNGGSATGGNPIGTGGKATGGSAGNSGSGGAMGSGGITMGGASGAGGKTGTPDASISAYHPCPTDGTACKIMPFGDSITDGYNQDTPGGYRVELFRLAHSAGKNITFVGSGYNGPDTVDGAAFPHNHEGHSGWTIAPAGGRSGISTLVSTVMPKYTPDIILLMIGTNDAIDNYDMANAPTRLKALIDSIYALLPKVLIVVAQPIPSRGDASKGDDTALSDRIKAFNATLPAVVKAQSDAGKHILLVDMFTPFNPNKASLIEDQWHPNLAGYVLLGTQWYSALQPLL